MALLFSLITAVAFTFSNIYFRIAAKGEKDIPALSVAYSLLAGTFAILFIFLEGGPVIENHPNALYIIPAVILWTFFGYMIVWLSSKMEASINALLSQTIPVFSFIIGILLFAGSASWGKVIGLVLIVGSNSLLFVGKVRVSLDRVFWLRLISSFVVAIAYLFDNLASPHFSLSLYIALAYLLPAFLVMLIARVSLKRLTDIFKRSLFSIFMISIASFIGYYFLIKAYDFDNISLVIPIVSSSSILTVIAGTLFLGEKDNLLKKIFLGIVVFAGVVVMGLS